MMMDNKKFRVGQILYVVLNKQTKVFPCQVVEEVTKKTLTGNSVVYRVAIGKNAEARDLNDIDGEVFTEPETVRTELVARATRMITKMVAAAQKAASEWYTGGVSSPLSDVSTLDDSPDMSQMVADASGDSPETPLIELPNGQLVKVKSVKIDPNFKTGS